MTEMRQRTEEEEKQRKKMMQKLEMNQFVVEICNQKHEETV